MKQAIAWLWTLSFSLNLVSCIIGNEPSWVVALTTLGVLTFDAWIDTII